MMIPLLSVSLARPQVAGRNANQLPLSRPPDSSRLVHVVMGFRLRGGKTGGKTCTLTQQHCSPHVPRHAPIHRHIFFIFSGLQALTPFLPASAFADAPLDARGPLSGSLFLRF